MQKSEIAEKVDELAKWTQLAKDAKTEIEKLKGEFQKLGLSELADKKIKQIEYWGLNNSKVVVTESETLKVQLDCIIEEIFKKVVNGNIKIEPSYTYTEPFKRVLISICQGAYIDQSLADVIRQMSIEDDKTKKALAKKLKGKWDKDVDTLKTLAGFEQSDAENWAYCIQEAINFEKITSLFRLAGYEYGTPEFEKVISTIKAAAIVEESVKVGVEAEDVA